MNEQGCLLILRLVYRPSGGSMFNLGWLEDHPWLAKNVYIYVQNKKKNYNKLTYVDRPNKNV